MAMQTTVDQRPLSVDVPDGVTALADAAGSSMMDSSELLYLAAAAASVGWTDGAIAVEIGAYRGQTTVFLASVFKLMGVCVPLLSIDPFERAQSDPINPQGNYMEYLKTIQAAGMEKRCLPLVAFSEDAAAIVPSRIGLLIVDGSHHYAAVSRDLALYGPKVLPGGMIFIDDYSEGYPDVVRATDEYLAQDKRFSVVHKSYFLIARQTAARHTLSPPHDLAPNIDEDRL